ncbi:MAG: hypothetical protein HQL01_14125 [Nitrospirae bacterium]|nr:hypothetical protein [Nitrospirota bacterium]
MPDDYRMPVMPIVSLIGTRAIETSSNWSKKEEGRKKIRQQKLKAGAAKRLIDIRV